MSFDDSKFIQNFHKHQLFVRASTSNQKYQQIKYQSIKSINQSINQVNQSSQSIEVYEM
jgi:hypothetical protein